MLRYCLGKEESVEGEKRGRVYQNLLRQEEREGTHKEQQRGERNITEKEERREGLVGGRG